MFPFCLLVLRSKLRTFRFGSGRGTKHSDQEFEHRISNARVQVNKGLTLLLDASKYLSIYHYYFKNTRKMTFESLI